MSLRINLSRLITKIIAKINRNGGIFRFYFIREHFYQPIPNVKTLLASAATFLYQYAPPGFDLQLDNQKELLSKLSIADFKTTATPKEGFFYVNNGYFGYADSAAYFGIIKHYKPQRIIEVGAGYSTAVALMAAEVLEKEGHKIRITAIEPYPRDILLEQEKKINIITKRVEYVPLETFDCLKENDILFIDSSHVIKTKNDVVHLYLEVLPRLKRGVLVQIHDISIPYEVHPAIFKAGFYWTEQYLLMAMLTHSQRYEVLYAGYYMNKDHYETVRKAFPDVDPGKSGGSFWIRIR